MLHTQVKVWRKAHVEEALFNQMRNAFKPQKYLKCVHYAQKCTRQNVHGCRT